MPKEMRENSVITQVEIDPISAHINQQLYQDTEVLIAPFKVPKYPTEIMTLWCLIFLLEIQGYMIEALKVNYRYFSKNP
jgi:hypothetical protein